VKLLVSPRAKLLALLFS